VGGITAGYFWCEVRKTTITSGYPIFRTAGCYVEGCEEEERRMCAILSCADAGVKERRRLCCCRLRNGVGGGVPANGCAGQESVRSADITAAMCSSAARS